MCIQEGGCSCREFGLVGGREGSLMEAPSLMFLRCELEFWRAKGGFRRMRGGGHEKIFVSVTEWES